MTDIQTMPSTSAEDARPESRFVRFMTTLPGIVTALAGLVTAMGGYYFAGQGGGGSSDRPAPDPQVIVLPPASTPAPTLPPVVRSVDVDASAVIDEWADEIDPQLQLIVDDCADGSDAACHQMLDILTDNCRDGIALDCDMLYLSSPEGSVLESDGNSCGGRMSDNRRWCVELAN